MLSKEVEIFQNDRENGPSRQDWNEDLSELRTAAPEVMSDLAATKYYTPVPQPVLTYICMHDRLSDGAKVLWFHLYRGAAQWENWTIRRGIPALAHELNVGERTIRRRMEELESNSLIVRSTRFLQGRQLVNEIRVTLPYDVASLIQQRIPDRRAPSTSHPHRDQSANRTASAPGQGAPARPAYASTSSDDSPTGIHCEQEVDKDGSTDRSVPLLPDKTDTPNRNNQYIPREKKHEQALLPATKRRPTTTALESFLASLKRRPVQQGPDTPADNFKARILKRLTSMGFRGSQREQLANEVIYSVTHHKWQGCTAKAVNACLKLIKENRWRTPKGMVLAA